MRNERVVRYIAFVLIKNACHEPSLKSLIEVNSVVGNSVPSFYCNIPFLSRPARRGIPPVAGISPRSGGYEHMKAFLFHGKATGLSCHQIDGCFQCRPKSSQSR